MTDKEAAARQWIQRHDYLRDEITSLELRLEEMRDQVNKSVAPPKEIVVQTQPRNVQAEKIAEIVDFEKKINEKKRQYQELEKTTIRTIERMNDPVCENILIFRYCYRRSWKYIADKLHYRESYIFALHSKALEKVYPLIDWAAE